VQWAGGGLLGPSSERASARRDRQRRPPQLKRGPPTRASEIQFSYNPTTRFINRPRPKATKYRVGAGECVRSWCRNTGAHCEKSPRALPMQQQQSSALTVRSRPHPRLARCTAAPPSLARTRVFPTAAAAAATLAHRRRRARPPGPPGKPAASAAAASGPSAEDGRGSGGSGGAGKGSGGESGGSGSSSGDSDGDSDGGGGDPAAPPPRARPRWYAAWVWATALAYLAWRFDWRRRRREAAAAAEAAAAKEAAAVGEWEAFRWSRGRQPAAAAAAAGGAAGRGRD